VIRGRVVRADTGQPLGGARVRLFDNAVSVVRLRPSREMTAGSS
jgi:hypothetical protein